MRPYLLLLLFSSSFSSSFASDSVETSFLNLFKLPEKVGPEPTNLEGNRKEVEIARKYFTEEFKNPENKPLLERLIPLFLIYGKIYFVHHLDSGSFADVHHLDSGSFAEFEFSGIVIGALDSYLNKPCLSLREREWLFKFAMAILGKRKLLGSQEMYRYSINDWLDLLYEKLFKPLIELPEFIELPKFETLKSNRWFLRDLLDFLLYRYLRQAKSLSCPMSPHIREPLDVLEKDPLVSKSFHSYFEGMYKFYLTSLIHHLGSSQETCETDHSKLISKGEEIMLEELGVPKTRR